MQGFLSTSLLVALAAGVIAAVGSAELSARDVDRQEAYVAAAYAAEAAAQKSLSAAKSTDVDAADRLAQLAAGPAGADAGYGTANAGADAGYFDAEFSVAPSAELDLGDVPGGDVVVRAVPAEYRFDAIALDYGTDAPRDAYVTVVRSARSASVRCGFDASADGSCASFSKFVANTADASRNGVPERGFVATYGPGEGEYKNRVKISGFDPDRWDYRISFATLDGKSVKWSYRAYADGAQRPVANNIVELNAVGTAIDQYARAKVQKRISDELQPTSGYVLFSDGIVAK